MNRIAVVSSNVAEVGYDPDSSTLEVAFKRGGVYQYIAVPYAVFEGLLNAPSVGSYLDTHVKKAGYVPTKVSS